MGVKGQSCTIDIRAALKSYDFPKGGKGEIFHLDIISTKLSYSNERVSFSAAGVQHQDRAIDIH